MSLFARPDLGLRGDVIQRECVLFDVRIQEGLLLSAMSVFLLELELVACCLIIMSRRIFEWKGYYTVRRRDLTLIVPG